MSLRSFILFSISSFFISVQRCISGHIFTKRFLNESITGVGLILRENACLCLFLLNLELYWYHMKDSKIAGILSTFSKDEIKSFEKFIISPYFSHRRYVSGFFSL